jgi:hypothetical protein
MAPVAIISSAQAMEGNRLAYTLADTISRRDWATLLSITSVDMTYQLYPRSLDRPTLDRDEWIALLKRVAVLVPKLDCTIEGDPVVTKDRVCTHVSPISHIWCQCSSST